MTNNFLASVDALIEYEIPLVIIGGLAVNAHGYIRATEDADVIFLRSPESEQQLAHALKSIHAYWITDEIDATTGVERTQPVDLHYVRGNHLMMLGTDHGFLDVFDFVPGLPDQSVNEVIRDAVLINGRPHASLSWLRTMKQASGRPVDLRDLENLPEQ